MVSKGALDQIRDLQSFIDNFQVHGTDTFQNACGAVFMDNEKAELTAVEQPRLTTTSVARRTESSAFSNVAYEKKPSITAPYGLGNRFTKALPKLEQLQKPNAKHDTESYVSSNAEKVLLNEPQITNSRRRLSADLSSILHSRGHAKADILLAQPYYHERALSNPASAAHQAKIKKVPMQFKEPYQTNIVHHQELSSPIEPQHLPSSPPVISRRGSISSKKSAKSTKSGKSTKSVKSPKSIKNAKRQHLQEKKMMLQQQQQEQGGNSISQPPAKQPKQKYVPRTYEEMMRIPDARERMKFYEKTIGLCLAAESPISVWRKNLDDKNNNAASTVKAMKARSTPATPRRSMYKHDFEDTPNNRYEPMARPILHRKPTFEGITHDVLHQTEKSKLGLPKPNAKQRECALIGDRDTDGSNKVLVRAFSKFNLSGAKTNHGRATSWHYDNSYSYEEAVATEMIPPVPSNTNARKFSNKNRVSATSTSRSKEQLLAEQCIESNEPLNDPPAIGRTADTTGLTRRHSLSTTRTHGLRSTLTATYATEDNLEYMKNLLPEVDTYTLRNALIEAKGDPISAVSIALSLIKKKEEESSKIQYSGIQKSVDSEPLTTYFQPQQPMLQQKRSFMTTMKTSTAKLFKIRK